MEISAQAIAEYLSGEIIGDASVIVSSVARIEQGKPGTLCFFANPKYEHYLYTCTASIVLINKSFIPKNTISATIIKVDDAYQAIASLLDLFNSFKTKKKRGRFRFFNSIAFSAKVGRGTYVGDYTCIGKKCRIGKNCQIYPQVFVGDGAEIGDNTILYSGVRVYPGCKIGNNCIIHSNAVIGADGFGFAPTADGSYKKIPQTGIVIIEDNCEVGANTTIDRATMGATVIEKGVKIDNLIQIAHNVVVGSNTVIAAQTGIAGSAKIGKNCLIGGQVGIAGHLVVADHTSVAGHSGIMGDVKKSGQSLIGMPAIDYHQFMRAYVIFKNSGKK